MFDVKSMATPLAVNQNCKGWGRETA
jgi:hypothetical protein